MGSVGSVDTCAVSTSSEFFAVGTDQKVYRHKYKPKLGNWTIYSVGPVTAVETGEMPGQQRYLFGLGTDKKIHIGMFHTGNWGKSWKCITGDLRVKGFYVERLTETIYGLGEKDGAFYTCKIRNVKHKDVWCTPWKLLIKGGVKIAASFIVWGNEIFAVRQNTVWIHKKNGKGIWHQLTRGQPKITQIDVWADRCYGLGVDTKVYHWNAQKWNPVTPGGVTQFVCSNNFIHGVLKDKCLWRIPRSGGDKWQYVAGPAITHVARPYHMQDRLGGHL